MVIEWAWLYIDRPVEAFGPAAQFWTTVTGSTLSSRRGASDEFATMIPGAGDAWLKLQAVNEGGGAHPDFEVDDVAAATADAIALGATLVAQDVDGDVLSSPSGQLFCLLPPKGPYVGAEPFVHPDGTCSRVDQICIDIAPTVYDDEVAFWSALTGWDLRQSPLPEFRVLLPPAGQPVRVLLQRLGTDRAASAHVDIACENPETAREWHESLGARTEGRGNSWIVMTDPAGGTYCLTGRVPRR